MRVLQAVALLVAGAASGVAAVAVHGHWWGLPLAAVAVLVTLVAVGPGWSTRLPFAVGFVGVVARLSLTRPEGDFVLAADAPGYLLLLLTLVVAGFALGTLPRPGRGRHPVDADVPPRMSADEH
ncbi:hypothetical protein [Nocardioides sp. GXQ0305]|uniref:hypothetical protein n=1 Tax=Nocardioides sp. GXQ0305 TaxID=3423912 RepID=UPI003D7DC4AF